MYSIYVYEIPIHVIFFKIYSCNDLTLAAWIWNTLNFVSESSSEEHEDKFLNEINKLNMIGFSYQVCIGLFTERIFKYW